MTLCSPQQSHPCVAFLSSATLCDLPAEDGANRLIRIKVGRDTVVQMSSQRQKGASHV